MSEEIVNNTPSDIIPTWWQGGERYVKNISENGEQLHLSFINNALYGKYIWKQISSDTLLRTLDWNEIFQNHNPVNFEIGIGNGAFLADKAENHPEENWIGVEVFKKVFEKAASRASKNTRGNIRVIHFDADLILRLFPDNFLKGIYVNFPDPWPKNSHKRRRLLKTSFLELCSSKLRKGGIIHIATDHNDYAKEITSNILKVKTFNSMFGEPYLRNIEDCFPTKYYNKFATKIGAYFFRFEKI